LQGRVPLLLRLTSSSRPRAGSGNAVQRGEGAILEAGLFCEVAKVSEQIGARYLAEPARAKLA
jgi:hypothetical protein